MSKVISKIITIILHTSAIFVIILAFWPMAKWYFDAKPLWGVDFFYTATLTNLIKTNFAFPSLGWNYIWFTGSPVLSSFPILHYYLILPLTFFLDLLSSIKIWMLASLFLYFSGLYACFYKLSKNIIFSAILAIAGVYSVGVYGTLMWGGSLPNHATQAFYPWVIYFIIAFLRGRNYKNLLAAGVLGGLSILGHPQIFIAYVLPTVSIILIFSLGSSQLTKRIRDLIVFVAISLAIGMPVLFFTFNASFLKTLIITDSFKVAASTFNTDSKTSEEIAAFHRQQSLRIYTDTNTAVFIILALSFVFYLFRVLVRRKFDTVFSVFPFLLLTIYFVIYIWLFSVGISIYHGGWYRLFWATPFWLGLLGSVFWGEGEKTFKDRPGLNWKILVFSASTLLAGLSIPLIIIFSQGIKEKIVIRSNPSSAFPDVLSLRTGKSFDLLKKELVPAWINSENTDYRLYSGDQTINIWWNTLMKMPLARGYFDPPLAKSRGFTFWLDAALSKDNKSDKDQLEAVFDYPSDIAFNNTLFLLDWYSVKFVEAGPSPATVTSLPLRLMGDDYIKNRQEIDFNNERFTRANQILNFYELKDDLVSPIISATNSPVIGIFATDEGYETIIRAIADANLASKNLIPVKLGNFLDNIDKSEFNTFDALILYDYKYKNEKSSFANLEKFVLRGGKVFIDTGVENPESQSSNLPEIFPFDSLSRNPLGSDWNIETSDDELVKDVDFTLFSPPIFDKDQWNFSYPSSLITKPGSNVVLKNHGKVLLVTNKVGKGEIVWSGINLPYHVSRFHNPEEVKFFTNIVNYLMPSINNHEPAVYQSKFVSSQKRVISTKGVKGVLFKEQNYPGWSASLKSKDYSLSTKVYSAGPAYPGFMYASIPEDIRNTSFVLTFNYKGSLPAWFFSILSLVIIVFISELLLFHGKILGRLLKHLYSTTHKKVKRWWVKEDE